MTQMNEFHGNPVQENILDQNIARLKALQQRNALLPPLDQEEITDFMHEACTHAFIVRDLSKMITTLEQRIAQYLVSGKKEEAS